jgi:hypothetical protein
MIVWRYLCSDMDYGSFCSGMALKGDELVVISGEVWCSTGLLASTLFASCLLSNFCSSWMVWGTPGLCTHRNFWHCEVRTAHRHSSPNVLQDSTRTTRHGYG